MNASPVPKPTTARPANASPIDADGSAIAFPAAIATRPASAVDRGPNRSDVRPAGICIDMCRTNCVVVSRPIVARPTPYACDSRVATAPTTARFQPAATPTPTPPAAARGEPLLAEVGLVVEIELVVFLGEVLVVVRDVQIVLPRLRELFAHVVSFFQMRSSTTTGIVRSVFVWYSS